MQEMSHDQDHFRHTMFNTEMPSLNFLLIFLYNQIFHPLVFFVFFGGGGGGGGILFTMMTVILK